MNSVQVPVTWEYLAPILMRDATLHSTLVWTPEDRLAVTIKFHTGGDAKYAQTTDWLVGRDMFTECIETGGSGWVGGDARMVLTNDKIRLNLHSPFGDLIAQAPLAEIRAFILRTEPTIDLDIPDEVIKSYVDKWEKLKKDGKPLK